jgi:broad specificity phosphatase PhoE
VTRLLLLRHAESQWNAQGRWQGLADPALSARGEDQANMAAPRLASSGISTVVSSDLRRARDTAAVLVAGLALGEARLDAGLREYDVGAWSGLTRPEIEARWPGAIDDWRHGRLVATPGGERRDAFVARITAAVVGVAAAQPDDTIAVLTHGGVISAIVQSLGGEVGRVPHLAGRWVDVGATGLRLGRPVFLLDADAETDSADEGTDLSPSGVLDTGAR